MAKDNKAASSSSPEWLVIRSFIAAILTGATLLASPISSSRGEWLHPLDAIFMATSATCVTGLATIDPGSDLSLFGQLVLLCLIQIGGIGIMTFGTFLLVAVGRKISMQDEFVMMDSLGHEGMRGLKALLFSTIAWTFLIEGMGATLLTHQYAARYGYPAGKAAYYGIYHSISAFCNAGISLHKDNLIGFAPDKLYMLTVSALIVLGGIGFIVLYNISSLRLWRTDRVSRGRLTLHSRIVLKMTALLIVFGWVAFMCFEWDRTLASLPDATDRVICALFQSITPRTAGFNAVDMARLSPATLFMTMGLMFIGGSPASTAGGIKTTTLVVLILTVVAMMRGKSETELYQRTIPLKIVRESIVIFMISLLIVSVCFAILVIHERMPPVSPEITRADSLLFETISAFGTVGLSTGITPALTWLGKICIIVCMFVGRLGTLTVAVTIATHDPAKALRYPEEEVLVG